MLPMPSPPALATFSSLAFLYHYFNYDPYYPLINQLGLVS